MDPQVLQQLTTIFQQGLTLLQQAQQGGGGGEMAQPDMSEGDADMGGGGDMPPDPDSQAMMDGGGDMGGGMGGGMGGEMEDDGSSLHDRVSELESHTGLAKAAGGSLSQRIDALESEILGQEYEGPMPLRLRQLEKAAGVGGSRRRSAPADLADAPDEIPLDTLIKSAIQEGMQQMMQQNGRVPPGPQSLRKTAAGSGYRKAQQPHLTSDADLIKAARQWGLDGEDLDAPPSFGDILQMQYTAQQNGGAGPLDDDDD